MILVKFTHFIIMLLNHAPIIIRFWIVQFLLKVIM